jgi:bifunctional N-acetylglucosamine-1-phosphate-uridyltransferase/glucosamine-1-phosphate-acetyltransferase GlmU-like protein
MLGSDNYAFCRHENNILLEIKEKESFTNNKMEEYASNGTYYFKSGSVLKKYFQELVNLDINLKGEYYVSLVYNLLVRDNLKVNIFEIEKMLQWGTPYDLEIYKGWSRYFKNIKTKQPKIKHDDDVTLILPMAGKGSRFSERGYELPKPLIDVDGKPMIIKAVDCLPETNSKIFICLKDHSDKYSVDKVLEEYYNNTQILNISETTEGQACTCELGINEFNLDLEKPILISACDNGVYYDTEEYMRLVNDEDIDIIVWSFRNNQASKNNPNMYAWLEVDENNFIKNVSCKNFIYDDPLKTHAIIGTMFFRKAIYFTGGLNKNYIENIRSNNEFYVDDVLNQNIKAGLKVKVFEVKNYICWGTPDDYETYNYWKKYFIKDE